MSLKMYEVMWKSILQGVDGKILFRDHPDPKEKPQAIVFSVKGGTCRRPEGTQDISRWWSESASENHRTPHPQTVAPRMGRGNDGARFRRPAGAGAVFTM